MARYKDLERSQGMFLTVDLSVQLLPGTFEWTINYLIDHIDISDYDSNYNNDSTGAKAYPPGILLKAILYCYSRGIATSRTIEEACRTNITVKALACDAEPDHATIAALTSSNPNQTRKIFTEVLLNAIIPSHILGLWCI